mgnify:CR=1 FL=1
MFSVRPYGGLKCFCGKKSCCCVIRIQKHLLMIRRGNAVKAIVLSSGGVDSTTCLAMAVHELGKENVVTLSL